MVLQRVLCGSSRAVGARGQSIQAVSVHYLSECDHERCVIGGISKCSKPVRLALSEKLYRDLSLDDAARIFRALARALHKAGVNPFEHLQKYVRAQNNAAVGESNAE